MCPWKPKKNSGPSPAGSKKGQAQQDEKKQAVKMEQEQGGKDVEELKAEMEEKQDPDSDNQEKPNLNSRDWYWTEGGQGSGSAAMPTKPFNAFYLLCQKGYSFYFKS